MNPKVRTACIAAVAFCVSASAIAMDPSFALESTVASVRMGNDKNDAAPVPALPVETSALLDDANIVFAPPAEVVQKIPAPEETPRPETLRALVAAHVMPEKLDRETECLAGAVYFEAKGESLDGQLAVAEVVLNRASSGRFPTSVCSVVFQPSQFSFVRRGALPPIKRKSEAWHKAVAIADIARNDQWESSVSDALYFHASRVSPNWRRERIAQVGNHIFYR